MNALKISDKLVKMFREWAEQHFNFDIVDYTVRERIKELKEHPELISKRPPLPDVKNVIDIMELIRIETEKLVDNTMYKFIHPDDEYDITFQRDEDELCDESDDSEEDCDYEHRHITLPDLTSN